MSVLELNTFVPKGAHEFFRYLINERSRLEAALEAMIADKLLSEWEIVYLRRPMCTYEDRFLAVKDILIDNPSPVCDYRYEKMDWLESLRQHITIESQMKEVISSQTAVQEILGYTEIDIGRIEKIEPTPTSGSVNNPLKIITSTGPWFLRYSSALGGVSLPTYCPREAILRQILGEEAFKVLVDPEVTTETIYPSLGEAIAHFRAGESGTVLNRIQERIIIQPYYGDEYFRLQEYREVGKDFEWMLRVFARIHALIQCSTFGSNLMLGKGFAPEAFSIIKDYLEFYRYQSVKEYKEWLIKGNWVTWMVRSLRRRRNVKNVPPTDLSVVDFYEQIRDEFLRNGIDLENIWWQCIPRLVDFWRYGAVLCPPDLNPANAFCRKVDEHIRLYDFDYLGFFDGAYNLGQGVYTILRLADVIEGIVCPVRLAELAEFFLEEYYENVGRFLSQYERRTPNYVDSGEFRGVARRVGTLSFFYTMVHEVREKSLNEAKVASVKELTRRLLTMEP